MPKLYFEGTYKFDYDIESIHQNILKYLMWEKETQIPNIDKKIKKYNNKLKIKNLKRVKINKLNSKIDSLLKRKKEIETGEKLENYKKKVEKLFNKFPKKKKKSCTFNFGEERSKNYDDQELKKRLYVISEFLKIASNYAIINIKREYETKINNFCFYCCEELINGDIIDNDYVICNYCQSKNPLSKEDYNNTKKFIFREDDSIDNFIRVMDRYEGKISKKIPESLYKGLDDYFISCERPTGEEIKELPLKGRFRGDTSHKMLRDALNSIDASNYYKYIENIGNEYWGWILPNISNYRDEIIEHYKITQNIYNDIPNHIRGRESSLGTQYRLWKHLQLVGYNCDRSEFNIPDNKDSLHSHQKLWKYMCDKTNDKNIYYIKD